MSKKHTIRHIIPHIYNLSDKESYWPYAFWLGYEWWIRWRKLLNRISLEIRG